jgi:hypothetical protein
MVKSLYFGSYNYKVDRYWETGPTEIYLKYLEYRYISFGNCSKTPKYYIYAGNYEANEYKYPITGYFILTGKTYIYLPIKYINYKGPHFAISNSCLKKRVVIEETKRKK